MILRLKADFNGLCGDLLCLSHSDCAPDETGREVKLSEGMEVVAFEPDVGDDGVIFLVARGRVVPSPADLGHLGSVWCLSINENGVRHVPTLDDS